MSAAFDLAGRGAVVTGGSSGIGLAMARALAGAGAAVALWGRDVGKAERAADELRSLGASAHAVRCDVSAEDQVAAAFAETVAAIGAVDVCIANAGVPGAGMPFVDTTLDEFRRVTAVDLDGVFLTLREAARHMVERGEGGSLVAVASVLAARGEPRAQAYAASKGGVVAMVRAVAVELGEHGIRANTVVPGYVETPLAAPMLAWDRFATRTLPRMAAGRWGAPDDLGGVAVYLASDASRWHTGDTITVDGGFCAS